jgi:hypothetical protein
LKRAEHRPGSTGIALKRGPRSNGTTSRSDGYSALRDPQFHLRGSLSLFQGQSFTARSSRSSLGRGKPRLIGLGATAWNEPRPGSRIGRGGFRTARVFEFGGIFSYESVAAIAPPHLEESREMIRTVADLLHALLTKEREKLPDYSAIQHPGIFGEMFEGLTKLVLGKGLFEGLDLRVVSGKIRNSAGKLSLHIDCMIVIGEGEQIPHTSHFFYPLDRVVMIVEVKKTLYGAALQEALELFRHFQREIAEPLPAKSQLLGDAWRGLFRENLPKREEFATRPFDQQMIYHTLVVEACLPPRVVFGYDGYVDEHGLRSGFIKILENAGARPLEERPRFNINSFPNLIVCRGNSLIKLDGLPYNGDLLSNGEWIWLASSHANPLNILLEILWTRLAHMFNLSSAIFGEDLDVEIVSPLMAARAVDTGGVQGWEYEIIALTPEFLAGSGEHQDWHPSELTEPEFIAMNILCLGGDIDISDAEFVTAVEKHGTTVTALCAGLSEKQLATVNGTKLQLLTDECSCVILPDGRYIASENKTGRLVRYALKESEQIRQRVSTAI